MRIVYDNKSRSYKVEVGLCDICFSCGYKEDCPLLVELEKQNIFVKSGNFTKEECRLYFYSVDENLERVARGIYFGKAEDLGLSE